MSAVPIKSEKITGSTGTTSTATITAPAPGNTLLVIVTIPTASAPAVSLSDPLNGPWGAPDHSSGGLYGSLTCYFYRKSNIANAPTSLSVQGTTGSFAATFEVIEVAGLDNASPPVSIKAKTDLSEGLSAVTHTASITTSNANDFVLMLITSSNERLLDSADGGYSVVPPETVNMWVHAAYLADAGAVGAKSTLLTFSGHTSARILGVVYKAAASGPTVSTITIGSVTEGGAASVTVALSGATSASTNFACSHVGVDATGADLTLSLNGVTCTNGVTCDGTNFSVPSGVSGWSFSVQTTADALDEANETATLTIGGIAQTLTITDDDATPVVIIPGPATVDGGDSVVLPYTIPVVSGRVTQARLVLTDGTAVGGVNYTNTFPAATLSDGVTISAGVLSIPAGVGSFTITIPTTA